MTDHDIRRRIELTPQADRQHARPARALTETEQQIARLLADGQQIKQIAGTLRLGATTVKHHIRMIASALPQDEDSLANFSPRLRVTIWAVAEYRTGRAA